MPLTACAACRSIQSWKLSDIKRDDYAPNTPGQRQWEMDRKKWLANRLVQVVKVSPTLREQAYAWYMSTQ
jgi:hypothetical protein